MGIRLLQDMGQTHAKLGGSGMNGEGVGEHNDVYLKVNFEISRIAEIVLISGDLAIG